MAGIFPISDTDDIEMLPDVDHILGLAVVDPQRTSCGMYERYWLLVLYVTAMKIRGLFGKLHLVRTL